MFLAFDWFGETYKAIIGAASTAGLVTIGGTYLVSRLQRDRQVFEIRTQLLERTGASAQAMYVACQHASRMLRELDEKEQRQLDAKEREEIKTGKFLVNTALDEAYRVFWPDAAAIESVLEARYGAREPEPRSLAIEDANAADLWHSVRDLLTVYYFELRDQTNLVQARNTVGHEGKLHSGLDLGDLLSREPRARRTELRRAFETSLSLLSRRLLAESVMLG